MEFILTGAAGFGLIHLLDLAAIKNFRLLKPVTWASGISLLLFSIYSIASNAKTYDWPGWTQITGLSVVAICTAGLVASLFVNLPFKDTYLRTGVGKTLVKTGLYSIVRHPGLYPFAGLMAGICMVFPSSNMIAAAGIWLFLDTALIIFQDKIVFPRMFAGYHDYKREVPMLVPSVKRIISRPKSGRNTDFKRRKTMSKNVELIKQGRHGELWQRCCGFIDLEIADFMRVQRRLLLEQIEMARKCFLGKKLMNGADPRTVEEFRKQVPLTTYADYAPYLLKRRMDGLPKKPILWQCTSGKSGESTFRWVPVTARQLDEIEPLIFALLFFSSCSKRGEMNFKQGDKFLYGMAPPPYATGTMTRVLPHEIFDFIPSVEASEQLSFEDRTKLGFKMAMEEGLDFCFAMSSVAVAIGNRLNKQQNSGITLKYILKNRRTAARLIQAKIKSKLAGREILPKDLWNLKGLVTFGLDGAVYREKIKEMWGRYPLDFHGCTEAVVIATQTWDHEGMTFVPNLNFFEFITEADSIRSYEDPDFVPRTYLLDEITPGNYELVITNFHGGPFLRYRLGHLVKIHSLRNDKLDIDIPQMSFIGRVDDQIDIAGFTRLSEKIIWQAIEKSGIKYAGWSARKETKENPVLNIYLETREGEDISAGKAAERIHSQLKKLDIPYSELEMFTGLKPIKVTLLPRGAFSSYKQYQIDSNADISHLKPPHLNPSESQLELLLSPQKVAGPAHQTIQV